MDNRWKDPHLLNPVHFGFGGCWQDRVQCRQIAFSNYISFAATAACKIGRKSCGAGASTGHAQ